MVFTAVFVAAAEPALPSSPGRPLETIRNQDRVLTVLVSVGDFLASGGLIVSLGLLLAVLLRRLGRAVAVSVIAYLVLALGWILLVVMFVEMLMDMLPARILDWIWERERIWLIESLTSPSLVAGSCVPLFQATEWTVTAEVQWWYWSGLGLIVVLKAGSAYVLYALALASFNRCLGRVSESGRRVWFRRSRVPIVEHGLSGELTTMAKPLHWGLGPVFVHESIASARRWQVYAGRSAFVLIMLVGMVVAWVSVVHGGLGPSQPRAASFRLMAKVGEGFFYALTGIQVTLVLMAAPGAMAGALGAERDRGRLLHLFVTDLSDTEVVLGTLAAHLAPVWGWILCGVPVMALAALLGGIEFSALAEAFSVSMALAALCCALTLAISVRVNRPHEVLMVIYVIEILWLLSLPVWWGFPRLGAPPVWFQKANPYLLALAPYNQPGWASPTDFAVFGAVTIGLAALLTLGVILRLRSVSIARAGLGEKPRKSIRLARLWALVFPSIHGPTLDGNPVLWRDWHRNRPGRVVRWLWIGYFALFWGWAGWALIKALDEGVEGGGNEFIGVLIFYLFFGFLMLAAEAPTSLAEERARGSLDVILTTPLATREIVVAKWWGIYRRVLVLLPLFLFVVVFVSAAAIEVVRWPGGVRVMNYPPMQPLTTIERWEAGFLGVAHFLTSGALIASLGLLLAVWIRRLGRAVGTSVIAFFVMGYGWIIAVEIGLSAYWSRRSSTPRQPLEHFGWINQGLQSLSPLAGPIEPIQLIMRGPWVQRARFCGPA